MSANGCDSVWLLPSGLPSIWTESSSGPAMPQASRKRSLDVVFTVTLSQSRVGARSEVAARRLAALAGSCFGYLPGETECVWGAEPAHRSTLPEPTRARWLLLMVSQ